MNVWDIAAICHEANRALCERLGDYSQKAWVNSPDWQHASVVAGVEFRLRNPGSSPAASHESWLSVKRAEGWVYGPVKDPEAKQHPCMVPFDQLPPEQQAKDHLFTAIVDALKGLLVEGHAGAV